MKKVILIVIAVAITCMFATLAFSQEKQPKETGINFSGEVTNVNVGEKIVAAREKKTEYRFYVGYAKFKGFKNINDISVGDKVTVLYIDFGDKKIAKTVSGKPSKGTKEPAKDAGTQSKQETSDSTQAEYLDMQRNVNSELEREHNTISTAYRTIMCAYYYQARSMKGEPYNREKAAEFQNALKGAEKSRAESERRIPILEQIKEKIRTDALQYYKGNLPPSFHKGWEGEDRLHKERMASQGRRDDEWVKKNCP
jgi:hypothetical protein